MQCPHKCGQRLLCTAHVASVLCVQVVLLTKDGQCVLEGLITNIGVIMDTQDWIETDGKSCAQVHTHTHTRAHVSISMH